MARAMLDRGEVRLAAGRAVRAIHLNPGVAAFHNTLGEILLAQGKASDAVACCREAVRLDPKYVPAWLNLGNALQAASDLPGASVAYWQAIQLRPDCAEAFTNLGNVLRAQGSLEDAVDCYKQAICLRPDHAGSFVNLAAGLIDQGHFADAEIAAARATAIDPRLPQALSNLSVAILNQGRFVDAETAARAAIDRAPVAAHLHVNLASVLFKQGRTVDAEAACRHALELNPHSAEAANNLGLALQAQDRLAEAATALEYALSVRGNYSEAWTNLGTVYEAQGRAGEALACFDRALADRPDFSKAHFCRSLTLLREGRNLEGFAEYEWRWKARRESPRAQSLPEWDGGCADGKTILLYAEQGLGDTIQFARFAEQVAAKGARVVLECQAPLARLAARFAGVSQVVTPDEPLPACDAQAALMSLPHLLHAASSSAPYLKAPADVLSLGPASRPRVGLAWAGNPQHAADRHRSIPLELLAPLRNAPVEWFSLHKGTAAADWLRQPLASDTGIDDLAALMSSMDLIVTVDSMPAHLAGALGRPVWVMLPHVADWRWLTTREDSPWYSTMRLFRQQQAGSWTPVVDRILSAIHEDFLQGLRHDADMQK